MCANNYPCCHINLNRKHHLIKLYLYTRYSSSSHTRLPKIYAWNETNIVCICRQLAVFRFSRARNFAPLQFVYLLFTTPPRVYTEKASDKITPSYTTTIIHLMTQELIVLCVVAMFENAALPRLSITQTHTHTNIYFIHAYTVYIY